MGTFMTPRVRWQKILENQRESLPPTVRPCKPYPNSIVTFAHHTKETQRRYGLLIEGQPNRTSRL